jgi:hypothetical protein
MAHSCRTGAASSGTAPVPPPPLEGAGLLAVVLRDREGSDGAAALVVVDAGKPVEDEGGRPVEAVSMGAKASSKLNPEPVVEDRLFALVPFKDDVGGVGSNVEAKASSKPSKPPFCV